MAGWDDDDDLLDAMLDDDDDVNNVVSIVATNVSTTTVGNNAVANRDDVDDAILGGNDVVGGGWDDDLYLDGLSSSEDYNENNDHVVGGEEEGGTMQPPPPPPPPPPPLNQHEQHQVISSTDNADSLSTAATTKEPTLPPLSLHNNNNNLDTTMENTFAKLHEHEKITEKEIETIRNDESLFAQGQQHGDAATQEEEGKTTGNEGVDDSVDVEEEWDFDEDEDIFNEDNDALDVEDADDGDEGILKEAPSVLLDQVPKMTPPPSSTQPPPPSSTMPPPPPHAAHPIPQQNHTQQLGENPFLSSEITHKDENPFSSSENNDKDENPQPASITTAENNGNDNVNNDDGDGDGWSDEDFFEDDDILSSSSVKPSKMPPPPPPHPVTLSPSSATALSRAVPLQLETKTAQHPQQQQQQIQSVAQPKKPSSTIPSSQPTINATTLNPTQRRIHQMLSNYNSTLHDTAFLTRLHQKLHLCQQQTSSSNTTSGDNTHSSSSAASDLKTYYATRPGLRKYTLGMELDRMDYELILGNGKSTKDKDVIRSYFGVGEDGERMHNAEGSGEGDGIEEAATEEELLIRSANQSLLADMLVALTGSEEDVIALANSKDAGLILSGPTLCMTSVAESCHFTVDLQCGKVEAVCLLAISVPFHQMNDASAAMNQQQGSNNAENAVVVEDGRLVLARAKVSVRFRPGEQGSHNDEPTVQYAVQSITPFHSPNSMLIRQAAISLAHDIDQHDPFFQNEYADDSNVNYDDNDYVTTVDARDRFLLSHHLLSSADSAALLAVSKDHIDKLKGAAEKSSTGFRSALRQLDGVTNVSAKLGGFRGGFSLALPSAEEIEAAERDSGEYFAQVPPTNTEFHFPRPHHDVPNRDDPSRLHNNNVQLAAHPRPPMPPPPPTMPSQADVETSSSRPRPLIGGLFMSGLSRLAAAATQPDDGRMERSSWGGGGGGTGLTPPSSPPAANSIAGNGHPPTLYQREVEYEGPQPSSSGTMQEWNDKPRGYTGLTPFPAKHQSAQRINQFQEFPPATASTSSPSSPTVLGVTQNNNQVEEEDEQDAGWSDDEFEFEDEKESDDHYGDRTEEACSSKQTMIEKQDGANPPLMDGTRLASFCETIESKEDSEIHDDDTHLSPIPREPVAVHQHSKDLLPGGKTRARPVPPPPPPPSQQQHQRTFDEEFVIVLKEKIEAECREMKETGRMKRWRPLREDVMLRRRLMEVMVSQIHS